MLTSRTTTDSPILQAFDDSFDMPFDDDDFSYHAKKHDDSSMWMHVLSRPNSRGSPIPPTTAKKFSRSPTPIPNNISPTPPPNHARSHSPAQRSYLNETLSHLLKRVSSPMHKRVAPANYLCKLYVIGKLFCWIARAKNKHATKKHRAIFDRVLRVAKDEGIVTTLPEPPHKPIPYWKQGNLSMYSEDNIRKRLELYASDAIRGCINMWWSATVKVASKPTHISKATYLSLTMAIYIVMMPNDAQKTLEDARRVAENDWFRDAQGCVHMSNQMFYDSIFELADLWCESVAQQEYLDFLDKLFEKVYLDETLPRVVLKHVEPNFLKQYSTLVAEEPDSLDDIIPPRKKKKPKFEAQIVSKPVIPANKRAIEETLATIPPQLELSKLPVSQTSSKFTNAATNTANKQKKKQKPLDPRYLSKLLRIQRAQELLKGILAILEQRNQYKLEQTIICRLLTNIAAGMDVVIPMDIIRLVQSGVIDKCHQANMERLGVVHVDDLIQALKAVENHNQMNDFLQHAPFDTPRDELKAQYASQIAHEYKHWGALMPSYQKSRPQTAPTASMLQDEPSKMSTASARPKTTRDPKKKQSLPIQTNHRKYDFPYYNEAKWQEFTQLGDEILSSSIQKPQHESKQFVTSSLQHPLPKLSKSKSPSPIPHVHSPNNTFHTNVEHTQHVIDQLIDQATTLSSKSLSKEETEMHRDVDVDSLFSSDSEEKSASSFLDDFQPSSVTTINKMNEPAPLYTPEEPRPLSPISNMLIENHKLAEKVKLLQSSRPKTAPVQQQAAPSTTTTQRQLHTSNDPHVTSAYHRRVRQENKFGFYISIEQVQNPFLIKPKSNAVRTSWVPKKQQETKQAESKQQQETILEQKQQQLPLAIETNKNAKQHFAEQMQQLEQTKPMRRNQLFAQRNAIRLEKSPRNNKQQRKQNSVIQNPRSSLTHVSRLTRQMQDMLSQYE